MMMKLQMKNLKTMMEMQMENLKRMMKMQIQNLKTMMEMQMENLKMMIQMEMKHLKIKMDQMNHKIIQILVLLNLPQKLKHAVRHRLLMEMDNAKHVTKV